MEFIVRTKDNNLIEVELDLNEVGHGHVKACDVVTAAGFQPTSSWLKESTENAAPASLGRVRRGDYISLFNLKREEAVCGRHYPTADERNAFRFGWDTAVPDEELDPNSHSSFTYPNATSAGYWEGRAYREETNK